MNIRISNSKFIQGRIGANATFLKTLRFLERNKQFNFGPKFDKNYKKHK